MLSSIRDFRKYPFSLEKIHSSGKYLGRTSYWKIYVIENILRIIIHTTLSIQYYKGKEWWDDLAGESAKKNYLKNKNKYVDEIAKLFSNPGDHPIYYIDIKDLNEIIRVNRPLFSPVITDKILDSLIVKIEELRIPRNIIAHMNFPSKTDKNRIDVFYDDLNTILDIVKDKTKKILIP